MLVLKSLLGRYSDSRLRARGPQASNDTRGRGGLPDRDVCRDELMLVSEPIMLSCFEYTSRAGACRGS